MNGDKDSMQKYASFCLYFQTAPVCTLFLSYVSFDPNFHSLRYFTTATLPAYYSCDKMQTFHHIIPIFFRLHACKFCQQNVAHIYDGFHRVRFVFAIFFSLLVIIHGSSIYCKYWCIWHSCITFYRQSVNVSDRFSMNLLCHFRVAFDIFSSENCLLWP